MHIECLVEKIKSAIAIAERMTGKNLTLPTLHGVFLIAKGKSLLITATNLNVGVMIEIPVTIHTEGSVVVKSDVIGNVCNHLEEGESVTLQVVNDNLLVQTKKTKTLIKCLPTDEFPTLPTVEGESFEIEAGVFAEGVRSVYFCAATTDIKPEIASVFIYSEAGTLCFVATDSFRLAEKKMKIKGIPDISRILIPYKNITDLLRVLDTFSGTVKVSFNKHQLAFSVGGVYFTTRLIDGAFPDYQLIVPKEELTKVVIMKQELLSTLRLGAIFSDKFFQVLFTAKPKEKFVSIESKNTDVGSSDAAVDAVIEGEGIEVTFNLKYFLDVFQSLIGDSISISFTKQNKPIVVRSVQDPSFLYLLVPTNR